MAVTEEAIKKELMQSLKNSKKDKSAVMLQMVERYLNYFNIWNNLNEKVQKDGEVIVVYNSGNEYLKPHPALLEMKNVNSQMINIMKAFDFENGPIKDKPKLT